MLILIPITISVLFVIICELYLLHRPLVHVDGFVSVSSQQMNLPEHHERLVVFIYLEGYV